VRRLNSFHNCCVWARVGFDNGGMALLLGWAVCPVLINCRFYSKAVVEVAWSFGKDEQ